MKRLLLLLSIFASLAAGAQNHRFSIGVSTGLSRVGYSAAEGGDGSLYLDIAVNPDWRFSKHWGLTADLGVGTAVAGSGADDNCSSVQTRVFIGPYHEWNFGKWYLDAIAGAAIRAHQPFYGGSPMRIGPSVCAGPAAGVRAGWSVSGKIDLFGNLRMERNLYDPLAAKAKAYLTNYRAGSIVFAVGARFTVKTR